MNEGKGKAPYIYLADIFIMSQSNYLKSDHSISKLSEGFSSGYNLPKLKSWFQLNFSKNQRNF